MTSNKDSRGVVRGKCKECTCGSYLGGGEGLKCYRCKHAPVKHENLSTPRPWTSTNPTDLGNKDTRTQTFAWVAGSSGSGAHQDPLSQHSRHQYHHVPPKLPKCKADRCSNRVHYEDGVGKFDYCSPECRDEHLLPTEQKNLKKDLEDLAKQLRIAPKQSKPKPQDLERHSGNQEPSQKIVQFYFEKMEGLDFGVILNQDLFPLDTGMSGFLITGANLRSKAYRMMKNGDLWLLDVITYLNGQPIEQLEAPFDEEIKKLGGINLVINRSIAIRCSFRLLNEVDRLYDATHLIAMRSPGNGKFGIGTTMKREKGLVVTHIQKGSIAEQSGVISDSDVVRMYAVPAEDLQTFEKIETNPTESGFKKDLKEAVKKGRPMVVVIARKSDTEV